MNNSFSGFFNERYYMKDHAYRRFALLREWKPFHIYKRPITFDNDDIKYLHQFPRKFWLQAMVRRYRHDLFEALKDRHERRQPFYEKKHKEILPGLIEQWKSRNSQKGEKMARRQAVLEAEEFAAKHPDAQIEYPETKVYNFKGAGKSKAVSIRAKPYMKQLVHKLEGDFGDPSGFDLSHPRGTGDHMSTRGFNFPTQDSLREMMSDWMNYIAHHMLGDLPDQSDDTRWRDDSSGGSGKSKFEDTFTVNRIKEERYRYWWDRIPTEENVLRLWQQVLPDKKPGANSEEIRKNNSKREQLARALAERDVRKMAEEGKIKTPPTPHHPQGRVIGLDDLGQIKKPSLYLPHKKVKVKYVGEDGEEEVEEEVPHLLPGGFLRKLSASEADSMPEESRRGKHWNPDSQRFERGYIPVTDHPAPGAQGTGHILAGAISPNHNTTGRRFLDPSDANYDARLEQLNAQIGMRSDGQSSEIYDAIQQALESSNVGGMGNHERQVLSLMRRDLHNLAYMLLMENLDEEDRRIFSPEWRKRKIRDMVAKYGQQDWGRGTRRLRGSKETVSTNDDATNEEGDPVSLGEKIGDQLIRAKAEALKLRDSGMCKIAPGGKRLRTGECQFEYDLRQLHDILDDANKDAEEADANIERGTDAIDGDTLGDGVQSKLDATYRAFMVLKAQYENMGQHEPQAEKSAMEALQAITHDDPDAKKIISRVRYKINKLAEEAGVDTQKAKLQPVEKGTESVQDEEEVRRAATNLSEVEKVLQGLLDQGQVERYLTRVNQPNFAASLTQLMEKYPSLKSRYQRLLQQVADVKRQRATPVPAIPDDTEAKKAAATANRMGLKQMILDDRLDMIPFNAQFRRMFGDGSITRQKVQEMYERLKYRQGGLFALPGDKQAIEAFERLLGIK
jgi:hypothetical protein